MTNSKALEIVQKMATERHTGILEVLSEYIKYSNNGEQEVIHFWPDENTACKIAFNSFQQFFSEE